MEQPLFQFLRPAGIKVNVPESGLSKRDPDIIASKIIHQAISVRPTFDRNLAKKEVWLPYGIVGAHTDVAVL